MFKIEMQKDDVAGIEKLRVQRVLIALAGSADRGDAAKQLACFGPEVTVDIAGLAAPAKLSARALVALSRGNPARFGFAAAATSPPEIEVRGNHAKAVSFGHAFHVQPPGGDQNLWLLYCRYEHELRREADGWRVVGIKMAPAEPAQRGGQRRKRAAAVSRALIR